jgi:hypothetical protein
MSGKWTAVVLTVALLISLANVAMFVRQSSNPVRPVNVDGVLAKDWLKDPQFRKAVEYLADAVVEGKDYLDKDEVERAIESCAVRGGGKINC